MNQPRAPWFDDERGAWIVSRFDDVHEALLCPELRMAGSGASPADARAAHEVLRAAATRALGPQSMERWRPQFESAATALLEALPDDQPLDLGVSFAEPWTLQVASVVAGIDDEVRIECGRLARDIFRAAAVASGAPPDARVQTDVRELTRYLQRADTRGDAFVDTQAFVALSQTLPSLLIEGWRLLARSPATYRALREMPGTLDLLLPELLRLAGPSQIVFREASSDLCLGGVAVRRDDRLELHLASANRDPARFPEPDVLRSSRPQAGHLAFGAGDRRCVGAAVVLVAMKVATVALLARAASLVCLDEDALTVVENDAAPCAIRLPDPLRVVLSRQADGRPVPNATGWRRDAIA